jgi:hypothetical protein
MTPRYAALAGSALALLAGCGSATSSEPRTASPEIQTSTLTVTTEIRPGHHGAMFTEGAVPEIRVVTGDGTELTPREDHVSPAVFEGLTTGDYRLRAVLRPCDGNCGYLDGPMSPCGASLHVADDLTYAVHWKVGEDCTVAGG